MTDAQRIAQVRKLCNWTRTEMAQKLGVSIALVCLWEKGKRKVHEHYLFRLAQISGLSLDFILNCEKPAIFKMP